MSSHAAPLFSRTAESEITRTLVREFAAELEEYAESDVLIAGGGPAGLICAKRLAERKVKVLVVERNNYLGGGFWIGGYLMNKVIIRAPAEEILRELGIPSRETSPGIFVTDGPHACSRLIAAACDAGVKILNMTSADDIVVRAENRVSGLVINWTAVQALPRQISCVDPIALEAKVVVDATGHDAIIARFLARHGTLEVLGCGPMWVERSEDDVVTHTRFVAPGLLAVGMAVSAIHGLPRMGPSFGAMLLSGIKGAEIALEQLSTSSL